MGDASTRTSDGDRASTASTYAATAASASAASTSSRKRSAHGCVCADNDALVAALKKVKSRLRDPTSHLAANYTRAIASLMHHNAPVRDARDAKQLKNIGNYLASQIQAILRKQQLRNADGNEPMATTIAATQTAATQALATATTAIPALLAAAMPIATRVGATETSHKDYAPAYKKQPWFVVLALNAERATNEDTAISIDVLLRRMQTAGYDGTLAKLRACVASLSGTHEVVCRTAAGLLFLTAKGQRSVRLCPGGLLASMCDTPVAAATDNQQQEPERSTATLLEQPASAPAVANVVCIDVSDSDSDSESAAHNWAYEPDEEPVQFVALPPSKSLRSSSQQQQSYVAQPAATAATNTTNATNATDLIVASDEWELVLVLDHREVVSRANRNVLERKLCEQNVTCDVRALGVGDMQWLAKRFRNGHVDEFVLNAIVERKEVRDLSGSIVDRRYNEQKTRLRASGVTNVVYLVEGSFTQQTTVRTAGLETALCRTQVESQFFVQLCHNADETVAFLAAMHRRLLAKFPWDKCRNPERRNTLCVTNICNLPTAPISCEDFARVFCRPVQQFDAFNALFRKKSSFTVSEMYHMMLTQVPGLNVAKALGVANAYPTLRALRFALLSEASAAAKMTETNKRKRQVTNAGVANVKCGDKQRRLGAKARANLAYLLTATDYSDQEDEDDCDTADDDGVATS